LADFSIESDLQRLEDWARDNVRRSKGTVSQTLRASALEFLKRMIKATPVDKGRAKAGWRAWLDDNGIFVPGDFGTGETLEQGRSEGSFREDLTGDQQFIEVVNGVPYIACVHGRTKVTVEGGVKAASAVRAGDMVLTQAGVYKPVRKVFSYKVPAGTDMVRLTSRWRKGKNHELLVTPHHKVLVYRGGRNKWVEAQDIQTTDALFQRRKISARVSPQLEPQPLPGAHYVAVNPGPATYADPETFGRTEVRGVELFQTEKVGKAGPNKWTVYDFEVEDIHSYFANGMVVSNSLEFGHSKQAPAGFVRLNIRLLANDQKLGVKEIEKQIKDADRKAGFR